MPFSTVQGADDAAIEEEKNPERNQKEYGEVHAVVRLVHPVPGQVHEHADLHAVRCFTGEREREGGRDKKREDPNARNDLTGDGFCHLDLRLEREHDAEVALESDGEMGENVDAEESTLRVLDDPAHHFAKNPIFAQLVDHFEEHRADYDGDVGDADVENKNVERTFQKPALRLQEYVEA